MQLILLLQSGRKYKISELADELQVSKKSVRDYKNQLEKVGIYINSQTGKYGGYYMEQDTLLPVMNLSDVERTALKQSLELLKNKSSFVYYDEYEKAINKVLIKSKSYGDKRVNPVLKSVQANMDKEKQKQLCDKINDQIKNKRKILIKYYSLQSKETERVIHPYEIFEYKDYLYVIGYCELREEIRDFKLSRVKQYRCLNDKYELNKDFKLKEHVSSNSIYKTKEEHITIKISYPLSYVINEYTWVNEQNITFNDLDDSIIFEGKVNISPEIVQWVLGMGSAVHIIEPESLREQIKEEVIKLSNIYNV
jgi:predicted DNA-binding transcriptional regulator YafY